MITNNAINIGVVPGGGFTYTFPSGTSTLATLALSEAFTNKTYNGLTLTSTTGTFTLASGKTFTVNNSLTLSGTDSTTMTFPTTSKTIAANDGSNWTFTSQAVGDIAYASSTTAYTRLAAVALGSVLTSAGTTTAPTWSSAPQITTIELGNASDTTLSRSAAGVLAVEGVVIPSISSTNILTNKDISKRLISVNAPGGTPTSNTDNGDIFKFTGLNAAITSMTSSMSGTFRDGQMAMYQFLDNATARSITWGSNFSSTTVTLPTTTVISTLLRVLVQYSSNSSKWECIGVA